MRDFAFLVPGPIDQLTGGYLYARRLVEELTRRGHRVAVSELAGEFPAGDGAAGAAAAAALAALGPGAAAVIDGLALAGFAECLAREARRLRLLALVHHPLADETGLAVAERARFAALERELLPHFAGILCPSAATAAALEAYGVPRERIAVALPGTLKPAHPPARRGAGRVLLSVATVTPRKGHRLLIDALARVPRRDWTLRIIGSVTRDPACVAELRGAIAAHGLEARVALVGEWPQAQVQAAYAEADIFALASWHEGYGMAFAEALAHGLPVVGTAAGAVPEVVPPAAGLLVPPGDVAALADAVARLIGEDALRRRLAAGAAVAGAALPDWPAAAQRWLAAAEHLLQ